MDRVLSGLEVEVLRLYVDGQSYQEIGDQLGRHTKSIDNALQRIKRKLDVALRRRHRGRRARRGQRRLTARLSRLTAELRDDGKRATIGP